MKKTIVNNACFFTFFTTLKLIWPKFCPKTTPTLIFFLVSNEICYGIQLILITLLESSSSEKYLLRPLKITIFWPNLCKDRVPMGHTINRKHFFVKIIKPDHKLSKIFYFIKISYVLAELLIMFFLICVMLFC